MKPRLNCLSDNSTSRVNIYDPELLTYGTDIKFKWSSLKAIMSFSAPVPRDSNLQGIPLVLLSYRPLCKAEQTINEKPDSQ